MGGCRFWLGLANQPEPAPGCGKGVGRKSNSSCRSLGLATRPLLCDTEARAVPTVPPFSLAKIHRRKYFYCNILRRSCACDSSILAWRRNIQKDSSAFFCHILVSYSAKGVAFLPRVSFRHLAQFCITQVHAPRMASLTGDGGRLRKVRNPSPGRNREGAFAVERTRPREEAITSALPSSPRETRPDRAARTSIGS
jgi:hypothetical protein